MPIEAGEIAFRFCARELFQTNYLLGRSDSFFTARFGFAQATPAQSPSAVSEKLEVETIFSIPLDQRRQLLSALTPEEREKKFSEQFRNLPAGGPSNGKINALFMAWSTVDPAKAIESAKKFPTADTRRVAVEAICYGATPEAAKMIAQSIKEFRDDVLPPEQKERLLGLAIVKWSQADPAAAAQFLAEVYPNAATRLAKPGAGDGDLLTTTKAVAANWGAAAPQAVWIGFRKNSSRKIWSLCKALLLVGGAKMQRRLRPMSVRTWARLTSEKLPALCPARWLSRILAWLCNGSNG